MANRSLRTLIFTFIYLSILLPIFASDTEPLRIGYGVDYQIFQYTDSNGDAAGISIDIVSNVLDNLNQPFEFVPIKRGEIEQENLDMVITFTRNEPFTTTYNRELVYYYAPLMLYTDSLVDVRSASAKVGTLNYLANSVDVHSLSLNKDYEYYYYTTETEIISALEDNKITHMLLPSSNLETTLAHFTGKSFNIESANMVMQFPIRFADHIPETLFLSIERELNILMSNPSSLTALFLHNRQKFGQSITLLSLVRKYIVLLIAIILFQITISFVIVLRIKRKKTEEAEFKLNYDSTTGLYTMRKFKQEVAKLLQKARSNEHMIVSLDIDNFSFVTDLYGLDSRKVILKYVATSLKEVVSKDTGLVCHEQSDKFLLFSRSIDLASIQLISQSFGSKSLDEITGQRILEDRYLTWHIGVYYIDDIHQKFHTMYENAVMARHSKEHMYGNTVAVFTYNMEMEKAHKINISSKMQSALLNHEFRPHFQPKINLQTGEVVGAEILARWYSSGGIIVPDSFIPIFEKNGFINKLDIYMFEQVCKAINEFPKDLRLSVNVSRATLVVPTLVDDLLEIVNRYGIAPSMIELEVTESIYAKNKKQLTLILEKLRNVGFCISLDDFGSEYSSLTSLYDFSPDVVKFDKSFVKMMNSESGLELTTSLINALHKTYYTVVVEGVETESDMLRLKELGADIVQGFYFSKPLPVEEFLDYIKKFNTSTR